MGEQEIIERLQACKTIDEAVAFAAELGADIAPDEVRNLLRPTGEVSDAELGDVSGGTGFMLNGGPGFDKLVEVLKSAVGKLTGTNMGFI